MSCNKQKVAGYTRVQGGTKIKKTSSISRGVQSNQYGTPKVRVSFAKRGS
ncbi:MAG: hypothetical protein ABI091_25935 [Ferruginibacter sp.]|jgi:hypothetical protein